MKRFWTLILAAIITTLAMAPAALAVDPDEMLEDPALEERAREISKGLRCVVCKNQSIDESDASLAKDLRILVRERLEAGDSNDEVVTYVVDRYGEFVLLRPQFSSKNLFLWGAPVLVLFAGGFLALFFLRQQNKVEEVVETPLSEEEAQKIATLIKDED